MKKVIGFVALFIAIGMLIMMITHNRLIGLIIIALLLLVEALALSGKHSP